MCAKAGIEGKEDVGHQNVGDESNQGGEEESLWI